MDATVLESGLSIIAQCKSRTGDIWDAHIGAAAIASYFLVQENAIPAEIAANIKAQAQAMLDKHSCDRREHLAPTMDLQGAQKMILDALDRSIDGLHWVGHNVIYSGLSLLALRELGGWGTKEEIKGISALVLAFDKTIPGRSWMGCTASEVKKMTIDETDRFPAIENADQLSELILHEVASFRTIYRAEAHHDLIGHMLTFSHALNIMFDLGYVTYFKRGIPPLLKLVKALRISHNISPDDPIRLSSPVDRLPLMKAERSEWLPIDREYWLTDHSQHDWDFGHVFKFPFSFYHHLNRLSTDIPKAIENFRYIVSN